MLLVANGMFVSTFTTQTFTYHFVCMCVGRGGRRGGCRLEVEVVCVCVSVVFRNTNLPCTSAVIEGNEIVYRDYVDISIAVATPKVCI